MVNSRILLFIVLMQVPIFANALDKRQYIKIATSTIMQMDTGVVGDIDEMLAMQEQLMILGMEGGIEFLKDDPQDAAALRYVIDKAEDMKSLSLPAIEKMWHQGKYLRDKGIDPDKIAHFGPVMSLMDAVIHPATSYLLIKEYKKTGNTDHLLQVKAELIEVLEHIKHVGTNESDPEKMLAIDQ